MLHDYLWKKIINNRKGLNDNIINKEHCFSSDNKSFKTGLKLSKEYDRNINLNPDIIENTEKLDEYNMMIIWKILLTNFIK